MTDVYWDEIRAELELRGYDSAIIDTKYRQRYLEYRDDIMSLKGFNDAQYLSAFVDKNGNVKDYFVQMSTDRVITRDKIHNLALAGEIATKITYKESSYADAAYIDSVKQFYLDIATLKLRKDSPLAPPNSLYDDFMKSIVVTDRDPLYDFYQDYVSGLHTSAIAMYTRFNAENPTLNPAPGTPAFDVLVNAYVEDNRFGFLGYAAFPKLNDNPSPVETYLNNLKVFLRKYYSKHPELFPEQNVELYSDYSRIVRFLVPDPDGVTLNADWMPDETKKAEILADYPVINNKALSFDSNLDSVERILMWYAKMKEYIVLRQVGGEGHGIVDAYKDDFDQYKKMSDQAFESSRTKYVMSADEFQAFLEERPDYIEQVVSEMKALTGNGIVAPADQLTFVDIRNWYRRMGLKDDGTTFTVTDEIQAAWDKVKSVALVDRDEAVNKLSTRFPTLGKYVRFASADLNDVEWQLFTRSSSYRNLKLHMAYNGSLSTARKGMLWLSDHSSFMYQLIISFMAYEFGCVQNASFALYVDTLSESKDQMDKDLQKLKELNALFYNSNPYFFPWLQGALMEYHDALELSMWAYEAASNNFDLAASGTYRFQAVIEEQDDVVTLLSVLPDKSDRIEFPTNHIPDKAEIGSIISFEIAKYDNPDIKTWTRVTENVIDVHDGDTITLANGMKIRILPINAPELKNPDGTANPAGIISGNVLRNMILDKFVDCYIDPTNPEDKFGRTLAYVYRNGVDLGQWMMDNGYAVLYRVTNAWFANICVGADLKYTSLEPLDEFSDLTPDKHFVTIKVPNFFMPFPADFEDIVFIRASLSESVVYKTDVVCFTDPPPGYAELHIEPDKVEVMVMDLDLLKKYIPSPCGKRVRVTMRRYFPCETTLGTNDSKAMYDHITDNYSFFNITAPDFTVYIIKVPTDKVPANVSLGDELIFTFTEILPYVTVTAQVTEITPPNVWLVHGTAPPYTFYLDQSLIPFPISVDDRIGIELGKNIGDYYSADFHARLGNNVGLVANFIKLPENVMPINIPLRLVDTVVQDPDLAIDPEKIQINDTAYFKILDKSFTNSFHARLEIIEGVNGIWKILPDEKTEITIPSTVAEEYFTTEKYSQYPSVTFSIKLLKDQLVYDPNQQIQIVSTDVNNTTIKFLHLKFGTVQATIPTRLFSWLPAVNDEGIFKMTAYSGLDSEKMYVDSISESEAKLISMTKKDISLHYPIDKLPQYLKRFDTVRLQIRTNGWTMVPSGQVAQDIVDKYTKTTTTKSGTVKRKVPARIPDTLDMFVIVRSLDNGYGDAMTERTDNNGWVDIPVFILPWDTDVGDTLSLNVSLNFYREIHFAARFMSLTMDGVCSFLVDPSMNFPFSVPLSWIPVTSAINDIIGFTLTKKVAGDTFDATHKITAITYTDITLQGISDGKIVTFDRTLLPYVMLPPPNYNITNLKVYTEFRLVTKKIS